MAIQVDNAQERLPPGSLIISDSYAILVIGSIASQKKTHYGVTTVVLRVDRSFTMIDRWEHHKRVIPVYLSETLLLPDPK